MKVARRIIVFLLAITATVVSYSQEIMEMPDSSAVNVELLDQQIVFVQPDTIVNIAVNEQLRVFNPDPTRATWLSVLCPGLGQIYNRRYWKLPIVVGAYMGLAYATSWNNTMLTDYTKAYNDLMDNDPDTNSYMDFFAPNVSESSLDKSWLISVFQSRKNYFRRNRDYCIVAMVGVYLLAIIDAYVDASLAHFDITPDLSLNWSPMLMQETRSAIPSVGVQWALCF